MAKIQVLDVQTANRIAAGEVVERPASVAKELLENALDAGATAVTLEIRDGGVSYLRVTDNGSGIAPEDCRVAFERHATSKIRSGDDLSHIGTLGFRGEALPSIASVSKVELTTRTKDAVSGVKLTIEGGRVTDVREAGCPQGTTFVVKDLFFNTPVRRKFLKRSATEAGYVADVVTELALSRPDIAVRFVNNGKPVFQTVGNNDLRSVIFVLHGKEVSSGVLPFESNLGAVRIRGFVGIGSLARGNRNYEFFFVNGRCIRNAQLSAAVENACRERVMIGKYPYCVCDLRVPLEAVDVNVHPNKLEVRFKDDFPIRENLQAAVETAFVGSEEILREARTQTRANRNDTARSCAHLRSIESRSSAFGRFGLYIFRSRKALCKRIGNILSSFSFCAALGAASARSAACTACLCLCARGCRLCPRSACACLRTFCTAHRAYRHNGHHHRAAFCNLSACAARRQAAHHRPARRA